MARNASENFHEEHEAYRGDLRPGGPWFTNN